MPTLRIRFVAERSLSSGVIRAAQLGWPFSHVDAAIDGGYLGAHASGGVDLRPIGYDAGAAIDERFYTIDVDEDTAARFHAFLLDQRGKPYDFEAIADFVDAVILHRVHPGPERDWRDPRRWICSELQAAALIHAGVFPAGLAANVRSVTPQNLAFALSAIALPQATGTPACPVPR